MANKSKPDPLYPPFLWLKVLGICSLQASVFILIYAGHARGLWLNVWYSDYINIWVPFLVSWYFAFRCLRRGFREAIAGLIALVFSIVGELVGMVIAFNIFGT